MNAKAIGKKVDSLENKIRELEERIKKLKEETNEIYVALRSKPY